MYLQKTESTPCEIAQIGWSLKSVTALNNGNLLMSIVIFMLEYVKETMP